MKALKIVFSVLGLVFTVVLGLIFFLGYMFSAGTHGSIKGYEYAVSKENLEDAIKKVILENNSLYRSLQDTLDLNPNKEYYNNGAYIRLYIIAPDTFSYIFRFAGDEENWKNNLKRSEIFICYAYDHDGNGGSEGGGGVEWYRWGVKKKLIKTFEDNFVSKLDEQLAIKHLDRE